MSDTVSLSLTVTREKADELERLAANTGQPVSALLEQALQEYLHVQRWQMAEIEKGLHDLDEGRVVSHKDMVDWLRTWGRNDDDRDAG